MSTSSVRCYVLGDDVGVVSDLNGKVTNVICPHFIRLNHMCALKAQQTDGALETAIGSILDRHAGTRTLFCEFTEPKNFFSRNR